MAEDKKRIVPALTVGISGEPKSGKSHLACTFPKPMIVFSFDFGLDRVLRNVGSEGIEVKTYDIPIVDTMMPKPYARAFWKQFQEDYQKVLDAGTSTYKTIVIDTGTALYEIARHTRSEELDVKSLPKECYGEVYTRLTALINRARRMGFNVVWTHYLKDVYRDGEPTGKMKTDGYKYIDGVVDIVLRTESRQRTVGTKIENAIVTTIQDCGFDYKLNGQEFENFNYDDLLSLLGV